MKRLLVGLFCLATLTVFCQQHEFDGKNWKAPYMLPIPEGWGVERFPVPPVFALQIPFKGIEDIRFAPGWARVNTEEYWSYAFLWYMDGAPEVNEVVLGASLRAYYAGLIKSNLDPAKFPKGATYEVRVNLNTRKSMGKDDETYSGTVDMFDYMQGKPIVLNCLIHYEHFGEKRKTVVFFELSPAPLSDSVWAGLNKLWDDFVYE
jgi:hypothetical protein